MSLTPFKTYTSYGQSLVAFSALRAGGFHPSFQNLHAAQMNMFQALALGGYWIFLPEDEHKDARVWQSFIQTQPIEYDEASDEIKSKNYIGVLLASLWYPASIAALPFMAAISITHHVLTKKES